MFNKLFKRQSESVKPPSEPVKPVEEKPIEEISVGFHVDKSGNLAISFEIPASKNREELYQNVKDAAVLLNAVTSGLLNEEVANVLMKNLEEPIANAIIENWSLFRQVTDKIMKDDDAPVVRPSDVFKEHAA